MGIPTTQIPVEFGGKKYSGIYSVSGTTLIARIPGLSSRSAVGFDGEPEAEAFAGCVQFTDVDEAIASVRELQDRPTGNLRVNAPMTFGTQHLGSVVADGFFDNDLLKTEILDTRAWDRPEFHARNRVT